MSRNALLNWGMVWYALFMAAAISTYMDVSTKRWGGASFSALLAILAAIKTAACEIRAGRE